MKIAAAIEATSRTGYRSRRESMELRGQGGGGQVGGGQVGDGQSPRGAGRARFYMAGGRGRDGAEKDFRSVTKSEWIIQII